MNLEESNKEYLTELESALDKIDKKVDELKNKCITGKRKNKSKKNEKLTKLIETFKTIGDDVETVCEVIKGNLYIYKYNVG